MGGANVSSTGHRYRRARRLRKSRRGVVAVVGTLLALLVFFALFGIFITQYVPLWMTDNESQFTSQAATSFADFKGAIDAQYVLDGPQSIGTPFIISSQSVPLLAQPTQGTLEFLPSSCPGGFVTPASKIASNQLGQPTSQSYCVFENVSLSIGPGGSGLYSQHVAGGALQMVLPNRYYNGQTFYFEDDAVIQSQGGLQQIVALPPPLNVTAVGGNTSVATSFLQLTGNASTVISQGSEEVFSHLRYSQTVSSNGKPSSPTFTVTYEIGTQYPCAWRSYLWNMMNTTGLPLNYPKVPPTTAYYNWMNPANPTSAGNATNVFPGTNCTSSTEATTVVALNVYNVSFATVYYAGVQVVLGIGGA
jgi:hypothetical protein